MTAYTLPFLQRRHNQRVTSLCLFLCPITHTQNDVHNKIFFRKVTFLDQAFYLQPEKMPFKMVIKVIRALDSTSGRCRGLVTAA